MVMKCHYEVLGIERDADDDAIKKSYRKLALKLHPDKNLENVEQATQEFRIVQQAYDVLADPQERAWYDKHREAILMGGMGKGDDYKDESVDVYAYFNSSCYSGFHDSDEGFYTVYMKVFEQISDEDSAYMDTKESECERPSFGDSLSDFDEVVGPFYGYWESYCTSKSYVWCEKYDTREAPDRMTRRAMEQENKKLCEAKKKERNEEVRKFLEEKALETAKLVKERRIQDKKEQLRKMEDYTETEWSAMSNLEQHLQALENAVTQEFRDLLEYSDSEEDEEEDLGSLFCVVCNKAFKTDRAFASHEQSKKHKENVALIRQEMLADDEALDLSVSEEDVPEVDATPVKLSKKQKKKRKQQQKFEKTVNSDADDDGEGVEERVEGSGDTADQTESAGSNICDRVDTLNLSETVADQTETESTDQAAAKSADETGVESIDTEVVEAEDLSDFIHKSANKNKKKGKKKPGSAPSRTVVEKDKLPDLACKVCKVVMPTRNKLFDHIKETGHAALRHHPEPAPANSQVGGGKSKRRNPKNNVAS